MLGMRTWVAGLIFGLAYLCAGATFAGWLLQRTAFDPGRTQRLAPVVLDNKAIREQIVTTIANSTAAQLGMPADQAHDLVAQVATTPGGAALFGQLLHDSHARLIGTQSAKPQITGQELVEVTRHEAAAGVTVTLDVPKVHLLDLMRRVLRWLLPAVAIGTAVFLLLAIVVHPDRMALARGVGFGLLLLAILGAVFGYLVPRFALPTLSDSPWADVPAIIADDGLPALVAVEVALVIAGLALLGIAGVVRRRRRWNHPTTRYRYSEERRWSV
jgi:LPXTG-motif cell wall-anchored protein